MIRSPMACATSSWILFTAEVEGLDCSNAIHPIQQYEIMQFTGLRDKAGKEIWEGDILQGKGVYWICEWSVTRAKWVIWTHNIYNPTRYAKLFKSLPFAVERLEVIGNIYENGDVLRTGEAKI